MTISNCEVSSGWNAINLWHQPLMLLREELQMTRGSV